LQTSDNKPKVQIVYCMQLRTAAYGITFSFRPYNAIITDSKEPIYNSLNPKPFTAPFRNPSRHKHRTAFSDGAFQYQQIFRFFNFNHLTQTLTLNFILIFILVVETKGIYIYFNFVFCFYIYIHYSVNSSFC
jgi:hypothetical protein